MGRRPFFRFIAAFIVLLIADLNPIAGLVCAAIWTVWVMWSLYEKVQKE